MKLTERDLLAVQVAPTDLLHVVDVSDTTQSAGGSSFKVPADRLNVPLTKCLFVDNQSTTATNARAQKGNITAPYKTIEAAITAATTGDAVVLLSDCEVTDNGSIVNNIFKNGITITDLGLGVKVSYLGSEEGWILNIDTVTNVDFRLLGDITFLNTAEIANSGCIIVNGCTNGNLTLEYNRAISNALTLVSTSNSITKTDSNFNIICNENMVDVTSTKTWRTAAILSELNNGGATKNYNLVCQTAKNIHGGSLIASDCVVTCQDTNSNVEVKNIVSNSAQNYVLLLGTTNTVFKNDILNSTGTSSSSVVLYNPIVSSIIKLGDITLTNSICFASNYNNTGAIDSYVYFNKLVSSANSPCVRFNPSNVLFTGTKIENTGGGAAIDINFGANGTSIIGNFDVRELKSNSTSATLLVNYGIGYVNANSDYKTRFFGDIRIENNGGGAAIGRNANAFIASHIFLFNGQVSLITDTDFPIVSNVSVGSNQTAMPFLFKKDGFVNNDVEFTSATAFECSIIIDDSVFSGPLGGDTLSTDYTFKLNVNLGGGVYNFTKFFAIGTTRTDVRDGLITDLNALFDTGGSQVFTYRGITVTVNFSADGLNIKSVSISGAFAYFYFITNSGLTDNGFISASVVDGESSLKNFYSTVLNYDTNISNLI
jgi:hypothetical protein